MLWKPGNGPGPSSSWIQLSQGAAAFPGSPAWQLCLCPFSPLLGAVAASLPLLRAWRDSWLSPLQLEQPKSLTCCKKSRCHLPWGSPWAFPCPANPRELLARAGMAPGPSCSVSFGAASARAGKLLHVGARLSHPAAPALGSQDSLTWFPARGQKRV